MNEENKTTSLDQSQSNGKGRHNTPYSFLLSFSAGMLGGSITFMCAILMVIYLSYRQASPVIEQDERMGDVELILHAQNGVKTIPRSLLRPFCMGFLGGNIPPGDFVNLFLDFLGPSQDPEHFEEPEEGNSSKDTSLKETSLEETLPDEDNDHP